MPFFFALNGLKTDSEGRKGQAKLSETADREAGFASFRKLLAIRHGLLQSTANLPQSVASKGRSILF